MPRMDKLSSYKTTVVATNGRVTVVYRKTAIVDADNESAALDSGGWRTATTTKRKMNQAANQFGLGYHVYQKNYDWYVTLPDGRTVDYYDGMVFQRA